MTAASLASPHPVSFREGGYLPLGALLPSLDSWDIAAMFALLFGVYGLTYLAFSYMLFRGRRPR